MSYRVGSQCFLNSETAHDYLLSQQLPTITSSGQLIRPIKKGHNWYLQGQKIELSFPECSIPEQIMLGGFLSGILVFLAVMVFGFNQIRKLIESMTSVGGNDDN